MNTDPLKEVTTVSEAAVMFSVTGGAIRQAIQKGTLYAEHSEKVHLIRLADALAYFKRQPDHWPARFKKEATTE